MLIRNVSVLALLLGIFQVLSTNSFWPANTHAQNHPTNRPQYHIPKTMMVNGKYPGTPIRVLEEYLRMDAGGGYLSNEGFKILTMLSPANRGMDDKMLYMTIVKNFKIVSITESADRVLAEVEYDQLGKLVHLAWFLPTRFNLKKRKEHLQLELVQKNEKWVLNTEILTSHISVQTALQYIKLAGEIAKTDRSAPRFIVERAGKLVNQIKAAAAAD